MDQLLLGVWCMQSWNSHSIQEYSIPWLQSIAKISNPCLNILIWWIRVGLNPVLKPPLPYNNSQALLVRFDTRCKKCQIQLLLHENVMLPILLPFKILTKNKIKNSFDFSKLLKKDNLWFDLGSSVSHQTWHCHSLCSLFETGNLFWVFSLVSYSPLYVSC